MNRDEIFVDPSAISRDSRGNVSLANIAQGAGLLGDLRVPEQSDGQIGDYWIDQAENVVYGPKTHHGWGAGAPLVGPPGPTILRPASSVSGAIVGAIDAGDGVVPVYPAAVLPVPGEGDGTDGQGPGEDPNNPGQQDPNEPPGPGSPGGTAPTNPDEPTTPDPDPTNHEPPPPNPPVVVDIEDDPETELDIDPSGGSGHPVFIPGGVTAEDGDLVFTPTQLVGGTFGRWTFILTANPRGATFGIVYVESLDSAPSEVVTRKFVKFVGKEPAETLGRSSAFLDVDGILIALPQLDGIDAPTEFIFQLEQTSSGVRVALRSPTAGWLAQAGFPRSPDVVTARAWTFLTSDGSALNQATQSTAPSSGGGLVEQPPGPWYDLAAPQPLMSVSDAGNRPLSAMRRYGGGLGFDQDLPFGSVSGAVAGQQATRYGKWEFEGEMPAMSSGHDGADFAVILCTEDGAPRLMSYIVNVVPSSAVRAIATADGAQVDSGFGGAITAFQGTVTVTETQVSLTLKSGSTVLFSGSIAYANNEPLVLGLVARKTDGWQQIDPGHVPNMTPATLRRHRVTPMVAPGGSLPPETSGPGDTGYEENPNLPSRANQWIGDSWATSLPLAYTFPDWLNIDVRVVPNNQLADDAYMRVVLEGENAVITIREGALAPSQWNQAILDNTGATGDPAKEEDVLRRFFIECFVHELGHILAFMRITGNTRLTTASQCYLHKTTKRRGALANWQPTGAAWVNQIAEAVAESVSIRYVPNNRVFPNNRTNWVLESARASQLWELLDLN